jgi:hypothetical protein
VFLLVVVKIVNYLPQTVFGFILHADSLADTAGNAGSRLLSLWWERPSAPSLALHGGALLSGRDAVPVAFEDFLGNPANDGSGVVSAMFELFGKFRLKLL